MVTSVRRAGFLGAAMLLAFACESTADETGGESNWFAPCEEDGDCRGGELRCVCGFCTEGECRPPPVQDGGTCAPLPCPSGAPWNPETCRCEGSSSAPSQDGSTRCAPSPCPIGAPWDFDLCRCGVEAPPPYCVAPCVWQAVKRCLPAGGTCSSQETTSVLDAPPTQSFCQPDTDWGVTITKPGGLSSTRGSIDVKTSAGACYSGYFTEPDQRGPAFVRVFGESALQIGEQNGGEVRYGPVVCGTMTRLTELGYGPTLASPVPEGVESYELDRARPECDAWDEWGFPKMPCEATPGHCETP